MIGTHPKMLLLYEMIRQVSRIDVPVLITGETGTGKELVARAIHDLSTRRNGNFGAVNCATLTEELFSAEFFGHSKGAFTGAVKDHKGLVERCDGGTLLLDEVADLGLANQVKLLRVLQEGSFTRVGGEKLLRSDFRVVSATNRDLAAMVRTSQFREDFFYRLNVFPIRVPSLRERTDDLPLLARNVLVRNAQTLNLSGEPPSVTAGALALMARYEWPGNVRELENVIVRAAIRAAGGPIEARHIELGEGVAPEESWAELKTLEQVEGEHVARVLEACAGNLKRSAEVLGISRTTLYAKVKKYGLQLE